MDQLKLIDRAAAAIQRLNEAGFTVIVVSNQAGIARGYYGEEDAVFFGQAVKDELAKEGAHIDAMYYCPHHPEAGIGKFRVDCDCRKPKPGMLTRAKKEFSINLKRSFMVGDRSSDIEAGKRAGCTTIMVRTGYGDEELKGNQITGDYVTDDLYDAVTRILSLSHEHTASGST